MSSALHRTTKEFVSRGASPVSHPDVDWIRNPDLSAVAGFDSVYWTITGDVVTLQTPAERDATDAALLATLISEEQTRAKEPLAAGNDGDGMRIRALIELFNKRDNYLTNRISELQGALDAIRDSSGPADNIRQAVPASWLATSTRNRPDANTDFRAIIDGDQVNAGE